MQYYKIQNNGENFKIYYKLNYINKSIKVFSKLKSKGVLSEEDVSVAMREVRIALLEADVSLAVAKDFIEKCLTANPKERINWS